MYDMYHWDSVGRGGGAGCQTVPATEETGEASQDRARPSSRPATAAQAVQVALDRRDNGGDASGPGGARYQ